MKNSYGAGFKHFAFYILNFAFARKCAGVALLLVVIILAALLSTGMAIFAVVFGEARISGELVDSFRAIYAADLGMERMLYCDRTAPDPDCDPGTCVGDAGSCTYPALPAKFVDLPSSLFPSNTCAEVRLKRLGNGNTQTDTIGEFPCGSATAVRRALRTNYQKEEAATFGFSPDMDGTLESGLVAYWPLDETSGTRNDVKGTNHLTDNNTVTSNPGIRGNAGQFTAGNSEYLSIGDNANLSAGNIDFTIAAWVLFTGNPASDEVIIQKGSAAGGGLIEYTLTTTGGVTNRFRFVVGNGAAGSEIIAASAGTVVSNTWYFIVAWHDATADTINIQVSTPTTMGAVDTTSWAGGSYDSSFGFTIGRHVDFASSYWGGRIDEVGIWKRVLSAQERTDLWNNGNGNTCAAPCQ